MTFYHFDITESNKNRESVQVAYEVLGKYAPQYGKALDALFKVLKGETCGGWANSEGYIS